MALPKHPDHLSPFQERPWSESPRWQEPWRRFESAIDDLVRPGMRPGADVGEWGWREVLLLFWVLLDPDAEGEENLTGFQNWHWQGGPFERAGARLLVKDWRTLCLLVDEALESGETS